MAHFGTWSRKEYLQYLNTVLKQKIDTHYRNDVVLYLITLKII